MYYSWCAKRNIDPTLTDDQWKRWQRYHTETSEFQVPHRWALFERYNLMCRHKNKDGLEEAYFKDILDKLGDNPTLHQIDQQVEKDDNAGEQDEGSGESSEQEEDNNDEEGGDDAV